MRKLVLAASALTLTVPALPTAAFAQTGVYQGKVWRGSDGRLYCKRPNGTTGLIIGVAGGALAGRAIDTQGSRATGTILGAALGALVGRHVERNVVSKCR
ncbi:MAG TPA: glycine zipper 2TM domain-containing protein [Allosphingosinicella sp.]|nr:glycine zipper 2TM domain-containing protein [Allosphingosinicella sp.]